MTWFLGAQPRYNRRTSNGEVHPNLSPSIFWMKLYNLLVIYIRNHERSTGEFIVSSSIDCMVGFGQRRVLCDLCLVFDIRLILSGSLTFIVVLVFGSMLCLCMSGIFVYLDIVYLCMIVKFLMLTNELLNRMYLLLF